MLCIPGSPALSDFRLQKLFQQFANKGVKVGHITSRFIHLVDLADADLTLANDNILRRLLTYGPTVEAVSPGGTCVVQILLF